MSSTAFSAPLSILSINVGRGSSSHELALSTAFDSSVDVLMVQEPRLYSELDRRITKKHPSYECFSPVDSFEETPRVMTYVRKGVGLRATQERLLPQNDEAANDLLFLSIQTSTNRSLMIVNVYNPPQGSSIRPDAAVNSLMSFPPSTFPAATFIAGDFNLYHPLWQPSYTDSPSPPADAFISWTESLDLSFTSQVDKPTHQAGNVLDLAFASSALCYQGASTRVKRKLQISSDHLPLLTNIPWDNRARERLTRLRLATIEEETFTSLLKGNLERILPLITAPTASPLDDYALNIVQAIQSAYQGSARRALPHSIGQPWWNEACALAVSSYRAARREQYGFITDEAKKLLRKVTRQAKKSFYKKRLDEAATSKDVFDIAKWHKSTGSFRCPPLRDPSRPQGPLATSLEAKRDVLARNLLQNVAEASDIPLTAAAAPTITTLPFPPITKQEVEKSILGAGNTTPGKDEIPTAVLRLGWPLLKEHVLKLFQACLQTGYHPSCFRTAILAILSKPNKADTSSPRSYRPIALLSVLGKGLERLIAKRMSWIAIKHNILSPQQFGALPLRSSVDLTTCLTHDIETALNQGLTASVLTLDVKGAFDAVLPGRLVKRLREQGWPRHLCAWVASFVTDRQVCIRLDGEVGHPRKIDCGLPQGSPVSPILFMLYISPLFSLDKLVGGFGYADDVASCKISPSLQENSLALTATLTQALEWGRSEGITFDPDKSELLHFSRKHADKNNSPSIATGSFVVSESTERPYLRWLGVLFDRRLTFKYHALIQAAKALKTAKAFTSLGNTLRGVSSALTRQVTEACVLRVAYFAAETWWPGRKRQSHNGSTSNGVDNALKKFGKVTLASARVILPAFSTTPSPALIRESGLSLPELKLDEIALRATVRIRRLDPRHPLRMRAEAVRGPLVPTRRGQIPTRFARRYLSLPRSEQLDMLDLPPWASIEKREEAMKRIGAPEPSSTKEQRASAFTTFINRIPESDIIVYTDGSKLLNTNAGAGFAITQLRVSRKEFYPLGPSAEIFDAEAIAALLGARAALLLPYNRFAKDLWVCLDNLEVALRLLSPSLTTSQPVFASFMGIREMWKNRDRMHAEGDIHIRWVPGHADVPGNELADIEARKGSSQLPTSPLPLSFAALRKWQAVQAATARAKWWKANAPENYRSLSIDTAPVPPKELQLPRSLLGRILAARTNHGDFADYHERFNHTDAEMYCSCGALKARFHFFFCRIAKSRVSRPPGPPSTLIPQLLSTSDGITLLTEWWRKNRFYEDICPYHRAS